jgi:hypothetical protein
MTDVNQQMEQDKVRQHQQELAASAAMATATVLMLREAA